jgi:hypothetical protein
MEISLLQSKIFELRGTKVLLDFDLALLYGVEAKVLNQAVKRNAIRFPSDFMFQITLSEWEEYSSQIVTSSNKNRGKVYLPFAFTEQGVAMLSSVLRSEKAVLANIAIMRAFVEIRKVMTQQHYLSQQFQDLKKELEIRLGEQDTQIIDIYNALEELMDEKEERKNWENRKKLGYK